MFYSVTTSHMANITCPLEVATTFPTLSSAPTKSILQTGLISIKILYILTIGQLAKIVSGPFEYI